MAEVIKSRYLDTQTIAEFCEFIDSGRPVSNQEGDDAIPAYVVGHILPGELKNPDAFAPSDSDRILKRHDIITGRVGGLGAFAEYRSDALASFSDNVLRLRPKEGNSERSAFVAEYLNSRIGNTQVLRDSRGSLQKVVTQQSLGDVIIPRLGVREYEIADFMAASRAERRDKLAAADELLAGLDDFVLAELGMERPAAEGRRVFGVRLGQMTDRLSPPFYAPELQTFLNRLRAHPSVSKPLRDYAVINPPAAVSDLDDGTMVGFIPMPAVSDGATGEYAFTERPIEEVRKGYTPFRDGDVLWAKITPCMQNGKSCIVEGLPNGIGFGSTEFHVLRVTTPGVSKEFVREFISQPAVRRAAACTFSGSAGQQRVPADFLANLPFPDISLLRQQEIVGIIDATRSQARRLRSEAEATWQAAKAWFEGEVLGYNGNNC